METFNDQYKMYSQKSTSKQGEHEEGTAPTNDTQNCDIEPSRDISEIFPLPSLPSHPLTLPCITSVQSIKKLAKPLKYCFGVTFLHEDFFIDCGELPMLSNRDINSC